MLLYFIAFLVAMVVAQGFWTQHQLNLIAA